MVAKQQLKTGTKVKISPKWDKIRFHFNAGIGTVIGRWGKDSLSVNFGKTLNSRQEMMPYDLIIPREFLIIVKAAPKGYKHPMSPNMDKVELFTGHLHGSGINYKWNIEETPTTFRASNAYDVMNDPGYNVGAADFTVVFPKGESMGEFRLEFNGQFAQRMNQRHMLRDYLTDSIAYTLDDLHLR